MVTNQTSTLVSALRTRARYLDAKLDDAHTVLAIFETDEARARYREVYAQCMDAWTTYWRMAEPEKFAARFYKWVAV